MRVISFKDLKCTNYKRKSGIRKAYRVGVLNNIKMKSLLLIFVLFVNYSFSQWVFDNIPEPKIKENGKCIVYYEFNEYEYINNSNIIDWLKSGKKINNTEPLKEGKVYLIEKFRQKESLKHGKFTIQLSKATKLSSGSLTLTPIEIVTSGEYKLGKLNGEINLITQYGEDVETSINLKYLNNKILDQEIIFHSQTTNLNQKDIIIYPKVIFKNGKVFESTYFVDQNWNYFIEKDKSTIISLSYTKKHIASDFFNEKLLECVYFKRNDDNDLQVHKVHIFDINNILFDTSKILASYNVVDNKLNGTTKIWSKNSNKLSQPIRLMNYKNNLLDGEYITFFEEGKIKEKYNFKNGYLNGKGEIYVSKVDNYDFILPKEVQTGGIKYNETNIGFNNLNIKNAQDIVNLFNVKSKSLIVPVALIMAHIGKNHDKNYNDNYYDINKTDYFKFCDLEFEYNEEKKKSFMKNYDVFIDSDKFMERIVQNCNNCFKIFDKNHKVILSSDIMSDFNIKTEKESEIEYQNLLKTEISCRWCEKKILVKDAIKLDLCNCIDKNNESRSIYLSQLKFYCSRKCASDAEKQICREEGYR